MSEHVRSGRSADPRRGGRAELRPAPSALAILRGEPTGAGGSVAAPLTLLSVSLIALALPVSKTGESRAYRWIDGMGSVHAVTQLVQVPREQREEAQRDARPLATGRGTLQRALDAKETAGGGPKPGPAALVPPDPDRVL